ncbi:MAG: PH domain-containing protein [Pirellulales bacterium]
MSRRVEAAAESIYAQLWDILEKWFMVPVGPPSLPAEPAEDVKSFRPAPGFLHYLKCQFWVFLVLIDAAILFIWIVILVNVPWLGVLLALPAATVAILPDIAAYVAIHLRYDTTWYVIGRRSLRIRRGIWIINETTITFENVQNIYITQGPLQRYFGIADVVVETAGGGGSKGQHGKTLSNSHVGMIEGIDNAEELRTLILGRLRQSQAAGLGDEEHGGHHQTTGFSIEQLSVLREIRDTAHQLVSRTF